MTGDRTARIRTTHGDPTTAQWVADALRPDNTDSMETHTDGACVVTTIERETTGGLQSTVDDYVVNLTVAETVIDAARGYDDTTRHTNHE